MLRSHIGYPSPKYTDTAKAHGEALGADEVAAVKEILGLPDEDFFVPDDVLAFYRAAGARGARQRARRGSSAAPRFARLRAGDGGTARRVSSSSRGLAGWESKLPTWKEGEELATRPACAKVVNAVLDVVPGLVVGAADLTGNTGMALDDTPAIATHDFGGRGVHYGIREHGMGAVMNGMAVELAHARGRHVLRVQRLHARRGAPRRALRVQGRCSSGRTTRSGLGEDGPTHQPIEQLAAMRAMPGLRVIRPADANEVSQAWRRAPRRRRPDRARSSPARSSRCSADTAERAPDGVPRGAYMLVDEEGDGLDLVLIGTGSEVSLCVDALDLLDGLSVRVVSMPSWELFAAQSDDYREQVLPARRADARGRGRGHLRLGALRRRRRSASTTSVRRRRARSPWRSSGSPPSTSPRAPARWSRTRGDMTMTSAIARLNDFGQSPWYDNLARPLLTRRRAGEARRGRRHPRRHVEPDDLRQGDRRRRGLRRAARRRARSRACRSRTPTGTS